MSKPTITILDHLKESDKNRISALNALASLEKTKLTKDQLKILSQAQIFLLGLGVQIKLMNEKIGGAE